MKLTCTKCGLLFDEINGKIEHVTASNGVKHIRCNCPDCGKYVKFMPQSKEIKLYFGKYKGMKVKEIAMIDRSYLEWLLTTDKGDTKLGRDIKEELNSL